MIKVFVTACRKMLCSESAIAILFFSVSIYGLAEAARVVSRGYTNLLWIILAPVAAIILIGLQEYCRDLIGKLGNFSPEKVVLSVWHFLPVRGGSAFISQAFLFLGIYQVSNLLFGNVLQQGFVGPVLVFFLPASYAYMSLTDDAPGSLNPLNLILFIRKLIFPYLGMIAIAALAYTLSMQAIAAYLAPSLKYVFSSILLIVFCANYIGSAIFMNNQTLGIVNPEIDKEERRLQRKRSEFERKVYQLTVADNYDATADFIESELSTNPDVTDAYVQQYLQESGYLQVALRHADSYIGRLVERGDLQEAWSLVLYILSESTKYYVENIQQLKALVDNAISTQQFEASVILLSRLANASETTPGRKNVLQNKIIEIRQHHLPEESRVGLGNEENKARVQATETQKKNLQLKKH